MQISRLFRILYILLDKGNVTSTELAEKFEVSQRTIYRDIDILSQSGIPIYMSRGKGGGISLLPNYTFSKSILTDEEKIDILTALKAANSLALNKGESTFDKLSEMLGNKNTNWIEIDFSSWGNFKKEKENFDILKRAVIDKVEIRFDYTSTKTEKTRRNVQPLKLLFKRNAWYLYCYCKMRKDYRYFKLRRMENITISNVTFNREINEDITSSEGANNLMSKSYLQDNMIKAKMIIKEKMAFRVYDEFEDYEKQSDGSFLCQMSFANIEDLASYVGTFGEYCIVVDPKKVVDELREMLKKMAQNYGLKTNE